MGDAFIVDEDKDKLIKRVDEFLDNYISEKELQTKYNLGKNYAKWVVDNKKQIQNDISKVVPLAYRPFDNRYTYFDNKLVWRTRSKITEHLVNKDNLTLVWVQRSPATTPASYTFIVKGIPVNGAIRSDSVSIDTFAPLYLYENGEKISNLDKEIIKTIEGFVGTTAPEDILDYVYAVLHSAVYRAKFGEFLKSDFPRVPYPNDKETFWKLVPLGTKLRELHLLTAPEVGKRITSFPNTGSDIVEKLSYKNNRVYINEEQYFDGVPKEVWEFYIGGYQPAQKYLKDRKGRKLSSGEFENYEKMTASLNETIKIMSEIDKIFKV
jgi:predicted helicase